MFHSHTKQVELELPYTTLRQQIFILKSTTLKKKVGKFNSQVRSQNCEKRLLASSRLFICLSARMLQLGFH
jgi:hypothetical protein